VDRANGNDGNDGQSFDTAMKTIDAAIDKCEEYRNNAIVLQGRVTTGQQFVALQTIDIQGIHLLGAGALFGFGGGRDSCFVSPQAAGDVAGAQGVTSKGGLALTDDDIEVAGLRFYGPDVTQLQTHIITGDSKPRDVSIHDNIFQGDVSGAGEQSGIQLSGIECGYVGFNYFYFTEYGLVMRSASTRYNTGVLVEENIFRSNKYGINLKAEACLNYLRKNRVLVEGAVGYGWALTQGLLMDALANDNLIEDMYVMHATKGNAYTDNGSNNVLQNCTYGVTSGTLVTYSA